MALLWFLFNVEKLTNRGDKVGQLGRLLQALVVLLDALVEPLVLLIDGPHRLLAAAHLGLHLTNLLLQLCIGHAFQLGERLYQQRESITVGFHFLPQADSTKNSWLIRQIQPKSSS